MPVIEFECVRCECRSSHLIGINEPEFEQRLLTRSCQSCNEQTIHKRVMSSAMLDLRCCRLGEGDDREGMIRNKKMIEDKVNAGEIDVADIKFPKNRAREFDPQPQKKVH